MRYKIDYNGRKEETNHIKQSTYDWLEIHKIVSSLLAHCEKAMQYDKENYELTSNQKFSYAHKRIRQIYLDHLRVIKERLWK
jgi:type II restriction/modification system DNA methylase subunit YeeA